jgi:hypothetical protein
VGIVCLLLGSIASADIRLAIVAGRNDGAAGRTPLKFAEQDAARVKRALVDVSGVDPSDAKLLKSPTVAQLDEAFAWAKQRIATSKSPRSKALLFVYLSAHGHEGQGVELGDEVLGWDHLKQAVRATGADLKIGIIDACNASGVLKISGTAADDFSLRAEDHLTVEGEAWITSSADNEPSLEAGAWRGSVFTHHLVAGLRGAADRSGDRKVSLEELYRYAFERTTQGQSGQHPGYAFRLAGYGELPVSDLAGAPALVTLPPGLDAVTVTERETGENLAEARHPLSRLLGLSTGRFDVRVLKGKEAFATQIELEKGEKLSLDEAHLDRVAATQGQLVRLSAEAPCLEVFVPHPDPRLVALKKKLEGTCSAPRHAVLSHADKGALKLELDGQTVEAATDDELLAHMPVAR